MRLRLLCINEGSHTFKKRKKQRQVCECWCSHQVCVEVYPQAIQVLSGLNPVLCAVQRLLKPRDEPVQLLHEILGTREERENSVYDLKKQKQQQKKLIICINADVQGLLERHQNNTTHTKHFRGLGDDRTIMCKKRKEERSKTKQQTV